MLSLGSSSVLKACYMPESYTTVDEVLEQLIEPLIRQDGGELFVLARSDEEISLHLRGKFSGCPGNTLVIRRVIEPALKRIAPQLRVSISSGEILPAGHLQTSVARELGGAETKAGTDDGAIG